MKVHCLMCQLEISALQPTPVYLKLVFQSVPTRYPTDPTIVGCQNLMPMPATHAQTVGTCEAEKGSEHGLSDGLTDLGLKLYPPHTFRPSAVRRSECEWRA
jgi:hypothetical protein